MDPDMGEPKGTNPVRDCQTNYSVIFALVRCRRTDSNVAFSPFSTQAALALVATGAEETTLEEVIRRVLAMAFQGSLDNFFSGAAFVIVNDGLARGGPDIRFSSGVWVDESLSLSKAFNKSVTSPTSPYNAEAKAGSFQTQADDVKCKVNSRVENTTTGIIQELLPSGSVNHNARLILENSLYFMGVWEDKFDASQTEESEFLLSNGTSVRVPFLTSKRRIFMDKYDGYKVLKLLYKKGEDSRQFTMHIFVPDDPDGLWEIPKSFGPYQCNYKKVIVGELKIPKFKISFGFEASHVLKHLGWTLSSTGRGDLKRMVNPPDADRLYVSSIYHQSVGEVREEGTEAAAATAAVVVEVEEGTEAATVTAAVAVEVVKGTKVANSTAAVSVEEDEEETEAATVVSMEVDEEGTEGATPTSAVSLEDDEEGTEGAAPTSAVSVVYEPGTESATLTSADSLEDDKDGTEAAAYTSDVSVDDDEKGIESATVTSSDSMEDDEEGTSDVVIFKADRPFAFVIREEVTGGVLFAGYMLNPLTTAVCNI